MAAVRLARTIQNDLYRADVADPVALRIVFKHVSAPFYFVYDRSRLPVMPTRRDEPHWFPADAVDQYKGYLLHKHDNRALSIPIDACGSSGMYDLDDVLAVELYEAPAP